VITVIQFPAPRIKRIKFAESMSIDILASKFMVAMGI